MMSATQLAIDHLRYLPLDFKRWSSPIADKIENLPWGIRVPWTRKITTRTCHR